MNTPPTPYHRLQRALTYALLANLALIAAAFYFKGRFVDATEILPPLLDEPIQSPTAAPPFTFSFRGRTYQVQPQADYELWGLVVTHNDTGAISDIYHDWTSVDTKDIAVIWGFNLRNDNFHRVKFWSGPWTCYYQYPGSIVFFHDRISNNHLITAEDHVRDVISAVRVGDQGHLRGLLVNYQEVGGAGVRRQTSLSRTDAGNGACEVVFVRQMEILKRGAPLWYFLYSFSWLTLLGLLAAKVILFIREQKQAIARLQQ